MSGRRKLTDPFVMKVLYVLSLKFDLGSVLVQAIPNFHHKQGKSPSPQPAKNNFKSRNQYNLLNFHSNPHQNKEEKKIEIGIFTICFYFNL